MLIIKRPGATHPYARCKSNNVRAKYVVSSHGLHELDVESIKNFTKVCINSNYN